MRKRWIWISVAAILLALGFALTQLPEAAPYDFLRGQTPLTFRPQRRGDLISMSVEGEMSAYTFRGDYSSIKNAAVKELGVKSYAHLFAGSLAVLKTDRGITVHIYRDNRIISATTDGPTSKAFGLDPAEGWVAVVIEGKVEKGWLDNLRSWLGL